MPKVSFILPAYKRRFLKEAIASILAQTYKDFELVVVDDHSPESLKDVVCQFSDNRLSYHCNEQNLGGKDLVAAWEHAMTFANGEWCVLASDDDVYHPDYLVEMLRLSEKYPGVDVVHPRICAIDDSGKLLWVGDSRGEYESPIEMVYNTAVRRVPLRAPDVMFRKSRYKEEGGFFRSPKAWFSDIGSWCLFARIGGAAYSNRVLFRWRESGTNISNQHHDLAEKTIAGQEFLSWLEPFANSLPVINEFDAHFKQKIKSGLGVTRGLMRWVAKNAPLGAWLKVLFDKRIEFYYKIRFVRDRICR